jgi:uncharacterized protein (TIGR02466 family)
MSLLARKMEWYQPWGPPIVKTTISDELQAILLKGGNKIRKSSKLKKQNDYRKRLAGNIKEEYAFNNCWSKKEESIVEEEFKWLASLYTHTCSDVSQNKSLIRTPNQLMMMKPLWINYMKQGEWNPVHNHTGHISCVTYLKVPKEIEDENKTKDESKESNTPTAGRIEFRYGDSIGYGCSGIMKTPREKDIYFFPAKLEHMVYPFQSKTERISVSVNFIDLEIASIIKRDGYV